MSSAAAVLSLNVLIMKLADESFVTIYLQFSKKVGLETSAELSPTDIINMKCQTLIPQKKYFEMSSANI